MSRITDIAKTMKTWWNEDDDPFVHRALDEIIRIDQEQAPSIEPKRGKWIWQSSMAGSFIERRYRCSNCQYEITTQREEPIYNYCPNCGARVKGADDE